MAPNPVYYRRFHASSGNPYIEATGGQVIRYGDWLVHEFYGSDTFDVTQAGSGVYNQMARLAIAGGASGGLSNYAVNRLSGGGGAGEFDEDNVSATVGTHAITIGAGGAASNGSDTVVLGRTYKGGGKGGSSAAGNDGGSGGGGSNNNVGGNSNGLVGYKGGDSTGTTNSAGGGGGASSAGLNSANNEYPANGGGARSSLITNILRWFGYGGKGNANVYADGLANTGSGGDGWDSGASPNIAGNGGSGYAAVKYFKPAPTWPSTVPLPIAQWHLDGNANDSIGTNNGTATNVTWQQGKVNDGAVFNGSSSKINLSTITLTGDFTVSFWFKLPVSASSAWGSVLAQYSSPAGAIAIYNYVPYVGLVGITGTDVTATTNTYLTPNVWSYITITRTGSDTTIYINGVQNGNIGTCVGTVTYDVMGYFAQYNSYVEGSLDEISIFDYAQNPTQIADLNTYYNS